MDRALLGDEPLKVFIINYCFLFLFLNFTFFRGIAERLPLCVQLGQPSCKCAIGCWQPSGKFVTGVGGCWQPSSKFVIGFQRLLATLWQISQRVLATFANSTYLSEGCQHPLILGQMVLITLQSSCQRVSDNLYRHLHEVCPINKEKRQPFCNTSKKLKVKIKILEATDNFKN